MNRVNISASKARTCGLRSLSGLVLACLASPLAATTGTPETMLQHDPAATPWAVMLVTLLVIAAQFLRRARPPQILMTSRRRGVVKSAPMRNARRRQRRGLLLRAAVAAVLLTGSSALMAEVVTVTTSADSGAGSLRAALTAANASPTATTIAFAAATDGQPIVLASALPDVVSAGGDLSIEGNGAANTIIDGGSQVRLFYVYFQDNLDLTFKDLMLRNGMADQGQGGAVYINGVGTSLTLARVAVVDNYATYNGGAVYSGVSTTVTGSTFRGNGSGTHGAAMDVNGGTLDARNVSFVQNDVGIATNVLHVGYTSAPSRMVNVTIQTGATNSAIHVHGNAGLSMSNCLIVRRPNYGGSNLLYQDGGGSFDVANSWNNVIGQAGNSGFVDGANGNQVGSVVAPLGPVGDYGGPTWTAPLLPGNVALDAGTVANNDNPDVPATDQRGQARVGPVDVGAFESHGFQISKVSGDNQSAQVGTLFAAPLVVAVTANDPSEPVEGGEVVFTAPATGASAIFSSGILNAAGQTQTQAMANNVVGGPYTVSAGIPVAGSVDFSLTNLPSVCSSFTFPYTLTGSDNATRVANLRQAIECANTDADANTIDLDGHVLVFNDGPYSADGHGPTALPVVIAPLTLTNGELERDTNAAAFRLLQIAVTAQTAGLFSTVVDNVTMRNGSAIDSGGGVLAMSSVLIKNSHLDNNHAANNGGAVAVVSSASSSVIYASNLTGNTAPSGSAIGGLGYYLMSSRVTGNGGANSASVLQSEMGAIMVGTVLAGNTAGTGSLLQLGANGTVFYLVNMTIADNSSSGDLLNAPTTATRMGVNTIIWGNQYANLGDFNFEHSITQDAMSGTGNLSQPPGFVDAASGDYQLVSGSPAIDAGSNGYLMPDSPDMDQDGDTSESTPDANEQPRTVDDPGVVDTGVGNAPVVDIGAFERQNASADAAIAVTIDNGIVTSEDGTTDTFTVQLDRYPSGDVLVPVTSSNPAEGTVSPTSLTFTQANWNQPQTVTITGVDDAVADGDVPYTIDLGPATSADTLYAGLSTAGIIAINEDNDQPLFRVGGTVTGLLGSGLQLSLNGGSQNLAISADGSFAFATPLASGTPYTVAISMQPTVPAQVCSLVNASGTVGTSDVSNIVVNCGSANTYAIGGSVTGLASGQSVTLQLNGGGDLALTANGSYQFAPQLLDGASYVVTIKTQPATQLCELAHASGQVAGGDVQNVDVSCADRAADWTLTVDDGNDFARYGQVRDYLVTLANTGNIAGTLALQGSFDAAFDVANVQWLCLSGAGGASCSAQGQNGFFDIATVPPNASVTWIVSAPILSLSPAATATLTVSSPPPQLTSGSMVRPVPVDDTDTLVIFRDGVDVAYADGTRIIGTSWPAISQNSNKPVVPVAIPFGADDGIHTLRSVARDGARIAVQHWQLGSESLVRLLATAEDGQQQASPWARVAPGSTLVLGSLVAEDTRIWLLEGTGHALELRSSLSIISSVQNPSGDDQ